MVLGIIYRTLKDASESDEERQKKAAYLRKQGQFLEAERAVRGFDRGLKIAFGSLGVKLGDWVSEQVFDDGFLRTENDARIWYVLNKVLQAEALLHEKWSQELKDWPSYIKRAIDLTNQALKAAILFPPFKEDQSSSICRNIGTEPHFLKSLVGYKLADVHGKLMSYQFSISLYNIELLKGIADDCESIAGQADAEYEIRRLARSAMEIVGNQITAWQSWSNLIRKGLLPEPETSDGYFWGWPWPFVQWETFKREDLGSLVLLVDVEAFGFPSLVESQQSMLSGSREIIDEPLDDPEMEEAIRKYYSARNELRNGPDLLRELVPPLASIFGVEHRE